MTEPPQSFRFLVDRDAVVTSVSLVVPSDADADQVGCLLRDMFDADANLDKVSLVAGDVAVGTVGRVRLCLLIRDRRRAVDEGDGAQLQSESRRYRLIRYACGEPSCDSVEWHVMAPEKNPRCPSGHGPLTYRP